MTDHQQVLSVRYTRPGWYALGRGGSAQARQDIQALQALGFRPVGHGRPPAGAEVVYGPTGTRNPGGPRSRTKWYVGRWYRQREPGAVERMLHHGGR